MKFSPGDMVVFNVHERSTDVTDVWVPRHVSLYSSPSDVHGEAASYLRSITTRDEGRRPFLVVSVCAQSLGLTGGEHFIEWLYVVPAYGWIKSLWFVKVDR